MRATETLAQRYADVRARSMALAAPLSEADCQAQAMPDASPTKWHLAHVTWFFETFVLERWEAGFQPHHPAFRVLFNSYYNGVGEQHPRAQRGLVTRPSLAEVLAYREAVDARMARLLATTTDADLHARVELGLHHEQQHQELILTDLLYLLSCNPLAPAYQPQPPAATPPPVGPMWVNFDGGRVEIGHGAEDGFAFDNETPRHTTWLRPYALARRPVSQGEWAEFIADGGYREPRWWLSAGWDWVRSQRAAAPLYWREQADGGWLRFTLNGLQPLDAHAPVAHISYFEADAYARWRSAQQPDALPLRLPTEAEWEHAAQPVAPPAGTTPLQLVGEVWEWTSSSYAPYPGFRAWDGAVGEYNAKFMVNQYVLRGASCATPPGHSRASYRNFFPTDTRWQFNGLRLAHDLD